MSQPLPRLREEISPQTTEHSTSLLIDAEQLAIILGISVRSVWRYHRAKRIPAPVRLCGTVRWRRAEIIQWINDGCPSCQE